MSNLHRFVTRRWYFFVVIALAVAVSACSSSKTTMHPSTTTSNSSSTTTSTTTATTVATTTSTTTTSTTVPRTTTTSNKSLGQVVLTQSGQAGGSGEVELQWVAVTGATGYRVFRSDTIGGPYRLFLDINVATGHISYKRGETVNFYDEVRSYIPADYRNPPPQTPGIQFTYIDIPTIGGTNVRYYKVAATNYSGMGPLTPIACGAPVGYPQC